jgi:hypothetical protein
MPKLLQPLLYHLCTRLDTVKATVLKSQPKENKKKQDAGDEVRFPKVL